MMKKYFIYTLLIAFVTTFSFTGCKDFSDDENVVAFEVMTEYMSQNGMDITDILNGWITARPATEVEVAGFVGGYNVFDFRSEAHFAEGHIAGAVNVTLGNLLVKAVTSTKPILCVCYTGQTAGHACVALRLSGYVDAVVLKWGMSGWKADLAGSWNSNSGATNGVGGVGHANWSTAATIAVSTFELPSISTSSSDGATILAERVAAMLTGGFKGTPSATVLDSPGDFLINNYWAQADVDHYGHIAGAYRINPLTIAGGELANLDPSKKVCTYCWTGQTSSMVTAYLNVLGYDATSLKFGTNSMIYSELESHKFVAPSIDYPVVQ